MRIRFDLNFSVGQIVKLLVLSDLALMAGWGLVEPIFSIFIIQSIPGATVATVGFSVPFYWLTKSFIELPVANYLDRTKGERDDFYALTGSLLLAGIAAISFIFIRTPLQLYLVQMLHGIAFGIYTPAWAGVFSRHLDRERESFDWSLDATAVGISAGISGFIGGLVANWFGFTSLFMLAGVFSVIAAFFVMAVPTMTFPPKTSKEVFVPEKKV